MLKCQHPKFFEENYFGTPSYFNLFKISSSALLVYDSSLELSSIESHDKFITLGFSKKNGLMKDLLEPA